MEYLIPTTAEAVKIYEENGGVLTGDVQFGHDPLGNREDLYESREHLMKSNFIRTMYRSFLSDDTNTA